MLVTEAYFERLINIQRRTVHQFFLTAGVLGVVGAAFMTCALLFGSRLPHELSKNLLTIAGVFVGGLSCVPFAFIARRWEKIATLDLLRSKLHEAEAAGDLSGQNEIQKLAETLMKPILEA